MLLIRRLWYLPAVFILILFYYYLNHHPTLVPPVDHEVSLSIRPERYPVQSYVALPSGTARQLPRIQHDFTETPETEAEKQVRLQRQAAVKDAFLHSWNGYKRYAWKSDEIAPLSGRSRNPFGGWGATLVDGMGTLWIMGLKDEFEECLAAVQEIDFTWNTEDVVNVFETTIRYLGGFLSAYDLSEHKYPMLLEKAVELADILYMTFDTPNRLPVTRWRWRDSAMGMPLQATKHTLLAEIGSLDLEFTRLAQLTRNNTYFDAVDRITGLLHSTQDTTNIPGLWPTLVDAELAQMSYNHFTLGGMADSTTEYLPKQFMLLGGLDPRYKEMYNKAINAAKKHLFYRPLVPDNEDILLSGNAALNNQSEISTEPQGQHLTCFIGGMVGISARLFDVPDDLLLARRLVDGCLWAYNSTLTGLMPETFHLAPCHIGSDLAVNGQCQWTNDKWYEAVARQQGPDAQTWGMTLAERGKYLAGQQALLPGYTAWGDNRYILRPELIESVTILYRLTGDPKLLDEAWRMFQSIETACKTPLAFAGISDVRVHPPAQSDRAESFWYAETLKYFYLIFSNPDLVSLDDWVFSTEAHPLKRPKTGELLTWSEK
ncbi:hypothetical protein H2198_008388 [Neophaeococcomyces mojaviensis]|uniref:Uncharacterized protein n=1 Tax=Neophaeococcomyces mojaviensis TaxID=3383035 RepID=A0ACC2ZXQ4_9EURO|nr:hypothetical protein H2198_008388 [Knufia sp. JES_112]